MLYSLRDSRWKLSDYGLIPGNTYVRPITTKRSTKDGEYSAPEVVVGDQPYTNKSDIWSLGCIIFEMMFQQTAFRSSIELLNYANTPTSTKSFPVHASTIAQDSTIAEIVKSFISKSFEKDPGSRPTVQSFLKDLSP